MTDEQRAKVLTTRPHSSSHIVVLLRPGYRFTCGAYSRAIHRAFVSDLLRFNSPAVPLDGYTLPIAQVIEEFALGQDSTPDTVRIAADRLEDIGGDAWVVLQWRRGRLIY